MCTKVNSEVVIVKIRLAQCGNSELIHKIFRFFFSNITQGRCYGYSVPEDSFFITDRFYN